MAHPKISAILAIPHGGDEDEEEGGGHELGAMGEPEEDGEDGDGAEGKHEAAEAMIMAFHDKDPAALVEALEHFLDICRPEEGEEPEEG